MTLFNLKTSKRHIPLINQHLRMWLACCYWSVEVWTTRPRSAAQTSRNGNCKCQNRNRGLGALTRTPSLPVSVHCPQQFMYTYSKPAKLTCRALVFRWHCDGCWGPVYSRYTKGCCTRDVLEGGGEESDWVGVPTDQWADHQYGAACS